MKQTNEQTNKQTNKLNKAREKQRKREITYGPAFSIYTGVQITYRRGLPDRMLRIHETILQILLVHL